MVTDGRVGVRSRQRWGLVAVGLITLFGATGLGMAGVGASGGGFTPPTGTPPCVTDSSGFTSSGCTVEYLGNQSTTTNSAFATDWTGGLTQGRAFQGITPVALDYASGTGSSQSAFAGYMVPDTARTTPPPAIDCLTCSITSGDSYDTAQAGISSLFTHGGSVYAVMTIQDPSTVTSTVNSGAAPGKGVDNDIYIAKLNTNGTLSSDWSVLTPTFDGDNVAVIWPRANSTGTELTWAQMYQYCPGYNCLAYPFGFWQLDSATISWIGSTPYLSGEASYPTTNPLPGAFYEPYGFAPNGNIVFSSSYGNTNELNDQIYTMPEALTGTPVLASSPTVNVDDEFAFFYDSTHIIYGGTDTGASQAGLDYWIQQVTPSGSGYVPTSGSPPQQITAFNSMPGANYADVNSWAIDPSNAQHILFSVCQGPGSSLLNSCASGDTYTMTMSPS
jgi:hypothetical protein